MVDRGGNLLFRPIEPADKDSLRALHEACFPVTYEDSFFDKAVHSSDGIYGWVALCGDDIVGVVTARNCAAERDAQDLLSPDLCGTTREREACYILTLGVHSSARRQGVASQLLLRVLRRCLESPPCKLVYLHTLTTNSASLQLYQRHAFKVQGTERGFYFIRGARLDAYVLCLYINGGRPPWSALGSLRMAGDVVQRLSGALWGLLTRS